MTPGSDAVVFSSIDWSFNWQGQHEVATRSAAGGGRVLFIENTSVRAPRPRDIGRIAARLGTWMRSPVRAAPEIPQGLRLYSPLVAPFPWAGWSRALNRALFVPAVRRLSSDLVDPAIWAFLPTPTVLDAIRAVRRPRSALVYYCVADFAEVTTEVAALRRAEDQLVREADVVFTNGEMLRRRFAPLHPRVRTFPFGVDVELFDPAIAHPEPADVTDIPRPRVGYVGALHRHLELDWIEAAVKRLPHVSFVLVGPLAEAEAHTRLRGTNVHVLGPKAHSALPGYVASFDACIVPYALSPYTESVVPTKLFEYLAMGKPVVTSDLPELRYLPGVEQVVSVASDAERFAQLIDAVASERGDVDRVDARRSFALRYSWQSMFAEMTAEIDAAMER